MEFLFQNIQSPPEDRAKKLLDALVARTETEDVLVLSELSSGRGSEYIAAGIQRAGYNVYWTKPERYEYSVLLAVRNDIRQRGLTWRADYGVPRAQFCRLRTESVELFVGGVYAPSLNAANALKRRSFFESIRAVLNQAAGYPARCNIFGGDINEIPPWHVPRIPEFEVEGFPFHSGLEELGLEDLARRHLPEKTYTWYSREGEGQLLDAAYVSRKNLGLVQSYVRDEFLLAQKLTDHSAIRLKLSI